MNTTSNSFGARGDSNDANGSQPVLPSAARGFVTGLRSRTQELGQDLNDTLQKALDRDLIPAGDPAMEHFKVAVHHLDAAQQAVTTVAMPLEIAERHVEDFKAAVLHNARNGVGASSKPAADGSQEQVQRVKALLKTNTHDAMKVEASVTSSTFWIAGIARHYRERAQVLESAFSGSGDEHSVMVLLQDDLKMAEKAFADASRADNGGPQLSGVAYAHRDATTRLFNLRNSIGAIPGLQL
ncbi:unnamed protein product [Scytosiphon promiscuus]